MSKLYTLEQIQEYRANWLAAHDEDLDESAVLMYLEDAERVELIDKLIAHDMETWVQDVESMEMALRNGLAGWENESTEDLRYAVSMRGL